MNLLQKTSFNLLRRYGSYCQMQYIVKQIKKPIPKTINNVLRRSVHRTTNDVDETDTILNEQTDFSQYEETLNQHSVRNLLYSNSKDDIICKSNDCKSMEQVFNIISENLENLEAKQLAQCVLVLWDLQKGFFHAYQINIDDFYLSQVLEHSEFGTLLKMLDENVNKFNCEELSCILLYLTKTGVSLKHDVIQNIISRIQNLLDSNVSLSSLSRFVVAVGDNSLTSMYLTKNTLPIIIEKLEKCENVDDFKLITICLNHLNGLVTNDVLDLFKNKVESFLNGRLLDEKAYRTSLKILTFLSYPQWVERNTILTSKIVKLLKDNIHELSVFDLFIPYEVIYKTQEPGVILNAIQSRAKELLSEIGEDPHVSMEIKLKLLSCAVCFTSSSKRSEYEATIEKCLKEPLTKYALFELLRLLTFTKTSNTKLCNSFWEKALDFLVKEGEELDEDALIQLSYKYINFYNDTHYRNHIFEEAMLSYISKQLSKGIIQLYPSKFSIVASFILSFGKNEEQIDTVTEKVAEMYHQFNHLDCLFIAKSLRNIEMIKSSSVCRTNLHKVNKALDKCMYEKLIHTAETNKVNYLLKTCIYKKQFFNRDLTDKLLEIVREDPILASHSIKNVIFNLKSTNALLPNVIDKFSTYVINYKDHLLGFNAEKIANLCYYFGYKPINSNEMFDAIIDVIIRDQERISGLSYIQAGLSLCYFKKLPESFIKHIFNVDFLDKLDEELATCYFKDVYPTRVRDSLMQLNRAVCLDYPQANVPWFHQKYIDKLKKNAIRRNTEMSSNVKSYLLNIVENEENLLQDVNTAYGYNINFLVELNDDGKFVKPNLSKSTTTKIAILLMNENAYTHVNVQLKGEHKLKKRHLELMGYKVIILSIHEWSSLTYGGNQIKYLSNLICSEQNSKCNKSYSVM